jgi:hypothetical protein
MVLLLNENEKRRMKGEMAWINKYDQVLTNLDEEKQRIKELRKIFLIVVIVDILAIVVITVGFEGLPLLVTVPNLIGIGIWPLFFAGVTMFRLRELKKVREQTLADWADEEKRILTEVTNREAEVLRERQARREELWKRSSENKDE